MLIAIEGIDGSGKGTQAKQLLERFLAAGKTAALVSFPRYSATHFGRTIGRFLNGEFGALDQVDPHLAATLYAADRLESKPFLQEKLTAHNVVICDRYVASNAAHQGAKRTGDERRALQQWISQTEFGVFDLPRPDLVILLDLPATTAQELIARKAARDYTSKKADIQEADGNYLAGVRDVYLDLAATEPNWRRVSCLKDGRLRSVEEIGNEVWQIATSALERAACGGSSCSKQQP